MLLQAAADLAPDEGAQSTLQGSGVADPEPAERLVDAVDREFTVLPERRMPLAEVCQRVVEARPLLQRRGVGDLESGERVSSGARANPAVVPRSGREGSRAGDRRLILRLRPPRALPPPGPVDSPGPR